MVSEVGPLRTPSHDDPNAWVVLAEHRLWAAETVRAEGSDDTVESEAAALIRYVAAGIGITFLPRFSASIQAARGELAIVGLDEESLQHVSAHLLVRARRRLPGSVALTAAHLAAHMVAFRA